ncbi:AAA family ATPase [Streptomyces prunicolor]|uniref:AAA family ATPase n=1 Tax=Streptomyces prunicolor TaxID=67348 RepID=UPI00342AE41C
MTTLFLTVGLPGAGKTTRARQLAEEHSALRLTPDEWMLPLFGDPQPAGKRDVLEGRLLWVGLEALKLGTDVILDFGCWSRDERSAIRWLVMSVGASCRLVYVPVDLETQRTRITHRRSTTPDQTFAMSEADLVHWRTQFEEPDATELDGHEVDGHEIGGPPPGWAGWLDWAADRWPSLA